MNHEQTIAHARNQALEEAAQKFSGYPRNTSFNADFSMGMIRSLKSAVPAVAASEQEQIDALREAVIDAADEWSNYVEVDNAPRRCGEHIAAAFDAARKAGEKA